MNRVTGAETNEQKEQKKEPAPKPVLPSKKPPPPPPGKSKLVPNLSNKTSGDLQPIVPKPAETTKDKHNETEVDGLDCVSVSSEKLTHPTASRPKPKGRRLPTQLHSPPPVTEKTVLAPLALKGHDTLVLPAVISPAVISPAAIQAKKLPRPVEQTGSNVTSESKCKRETEAVERILVEELKAEIREMSLALELLKNQHLRDIADLKQEIKEETTKRAALQAEVEKLKKLLPS